MRTSVRRRVCGVALVVVSLAATVDAQITRRVPAQFATIQAAINASVASDTVLVSPGSYRENIDFRGKAITVRSVAGAAATQIDGGGSGAVVTCVSNESPLSVLDGFTLHDGNVGSGDGGGMRCIRANPTVRNCWFRRNAAADGGALYLEDTALVTVEACRFEENSASRFGGAIDAIRSNLRLVECSFVDNTASSDGGAIATLSGTANLERCSFVDNVAGDQGGAISLNGTSGRVERCGISLNRARLGGGIALISASQVTIVGTVLSENDASSRGGGMDLVNASPTVLSTTIADNDAGSGGGVGGSNASPRFTNCIVWGNRPTTMSFSGGSPTATYSDVQGGFAGIGNISQDPRITNLAGGGYRLESSSPCINRGTAAVAGLAAVDFDGQPRQSGTIDIGADEYWVASGTFLDRFAPTDCRLMSFNVWSNSIFASVNPAQAAKFRRIVNAVDADILCLQEVTSSASQVRSLMNSIAPLPGNASWFAYRGGFGEIIASKYALSFQRDATVPAGERGLAMALVNLPNASFDRDLYVINTHFKCCNGFDPRRQQQADAIVRWMRDARTAGGSITLANATPITVVGDLNMVEGFRPVATLLNGDIVDTGRYGPDSPPDWDGSANTDLAPRHNGRAPVDYTWRDDSSSFAPGRLDYITYSDSAIRRANAFVLNTASMTPAERSASGLQTWDVARDTAGDYDHLPLVVDFRANRGPIHTFGQGCGDFRSGWRGTSSVGSVLTFQAFGAEPFERLTFMAGPSDTAWFAIPLPLNLDFLGAPDCDLLVSPYFQVGRIADSAGRASYGFAIPNDNRLIGLALFAQWAAISSANPADWRLSDAVRATGQP